MCNNTNHNRPHPCGFKGCLNTVEYADEPFCFQHSPDSGSSVTGYCYWCKKEKPVFEPAKDGFPKLLERAGKLTKEEWRTELNNFKALLNDEDGFEIMLEKTLILGEMARNGSALIPILRALSENLTRYLYE